MKKKSPMQSRSQWDSEKVKKFFLRLLSYFIFIQNLTASQIIEGRANHDSFSRSRLHIYSLFETTFVPFRSRIYFEH